MKLGRVAVGGSLIALLALSSGAQLAVADVGDQPTTTILVDTAQTRGPASTQLLGANHRYNDNGSGLWNPRTWAPYKPFVDGAQRVGLDSLRFPGGTIGNTYDWKRAIGDDRGCQIDGRGSASTGFKSITHGLSFGPDEFMSTVQKLGVDPLIMVSFVRETPAGAADWVEYMNSPADGDATNPDGGVDWAEVRAANGHPEPYGVTHWEIGNEQHHLESRHWLSADAEVAAREYADGATPWIADEPLGKDCSHPVEGVASDGTPDQVFEVLYPPVDPSAVQLYADGRPNPWRQVADLGTTRPRARVYELRPDSGEIVFGDGTHGRIPAEGRTFHVSYTSVHQGFFDFAAAMKAVDPSIDVCASFGRVSFVNDAAGRPFDCLTTHLITTLTKSDTHWADALEGHDRMMLAVGQRRKGAVKLQHALPPETPLWFTEAAAIAGDRSAFPTWATSATQAAYMATMWGDWMELGIGWGMSSIFVGGDRAVLGPRPNVAYSAEAVTREAISPMFQAGGEVLGADVSGNPVRQPEGMERSYDALAVTATRSPDGVVHVMVVNRLPTDAVTATLDVAGLSSTVADVRAVRADDFTASNKGDAPPEVRLETDELPIGPEGLTYDFPPTTTTVISLPPDVG